MELQNTDTDLYERKPDIFRNFDANTASTDQLQSVFNQEKTTISEFTNLESDNSVTANMTVSEVADGFKKFNLAESIANEAIERSMLEKSSQVMTVEGCINRGNQVGAEYYANNKLSQEQQKRVVIPKVQISNLGKLNSQTSIGLTVTDHEGNNRDKIEELLKQLTDLLKTNKQTLSDVYANESDMKKDHPWAHRYLTEFDPTYEDYERQDLTYFANKYNIDFDRRTTNAELLELLKDYILDKEAKLSGDPQTALDEIKNDIERYDELKTELEQMEADKNTKTADIRAWKNTHREIQNAKGTSRVDLIANIKTKLNDLIDQRTKDIAKVTVKQESNTQTSSATGSGFSKKKTTPNLDIDHITTTGRSSQDKSTQSDSKNNSESTKLIQNVTYFKPMNLRRNFKDYTLVGDECLINVKKLREQNALSLMNNTYNRPYADYKRHIVTNDVKRFILDLCKTGKFDQQDLDDLGSEDRKLVEFVLIKAGLKSKHYDKQPITQVTLGSSAKRQKERLKVLMGEIVAGNNNPELVKEIRSLSLSLYKQNILTKDEYLEIAETF